MAQHFRSRYFAGDSGLAVPTFTVADNGDGTGGVVTISGSTPTATNTFYYASQVPGASFTAFGTTRVGDGTIAINLATGTYFGYVYSSLASGAQSSLIGSFSLSSNSSSARTGHYWIDCKTTHNADGEAITEVSFFPVTLQRDHEPFSLGVLRDRPGSYSNVILGCEDGYLRRYQKNLAQDDGSSISSIVWIGPIMLGRTGNEGKVAEIQGETGANSGDLDWAVYVGKSAESAFNASAFDSGEWNDAGLSYASQPRAGGQAAFIKLTNGESNAAWALEVVLLTVEEDGKLRR